MGKTDYEYSSQEQVDDAKTCVIQEEEDERVSLEWGLKV